jgi:hypothetical protein
MPNNLHLVGSIPYDTVEDVFRNFGAALGPHLTTIPDGEVGPRKHWISRVHYQVLAGHPQLEVMRCPAPVDGVEQQFPRNAGDSWLFKVKDGIDRVRFGDPGWRLGYARDAVYSYFVFKTLREAGALPGHLRFQVSMPSVASALPPRIFPDPSDIAKVRIGYQEALAAELRTIIDKIPAADLAIQWDCATEMQDAYGAVPGYPRDGAVERNMDQFRILSALIPKEIMLGYHLCFGTLGGWPRFSPDDLSGAVEMANGFVEASGRPVDWLHIPVLDRGDDAFFAPLADLEPRGARVYLGVIHNMERYDERIALARKYCPDFGVAAYCGMGRVAPDELSAVLDDHLKAAADT